VLNLTSDEMPAEPPGAKVYGRSVIGFIGHQEDDDDDDDRSISFTEPDNAEVKLPPPHDNQADEELEEDSPEAVSDYASLTASASSLGWYLSGNGDSAPAPRMRNNSRQSLRLEQTNSSIIKVPFVMAAQTSDDSFGKGRGKSPDKVQQDDNLNDFSNSTTEEEKSDKDIFTSLKHPPRNAYASIEVLTRKGDPDPDGNHQDQADGSRRIGERFEI
jgi:hypothetical protein